MVEFTQGMLTDTSQFILFFILIIVLWFMNNKMNYLKKRLDILGNYLIRDMKDNIVREVGKDIKELYWNKFDEEKRIHEHEEE